MATIADLEAQLNDFSPVVRARALDALVALDIQPDAMQEAVNLHCHTFFSFNIYGYSPSGLAWLAKRRGFRTLGIVDFDALDGVEEYLSACERLGVRGAAGMETRVYIPEFASREINSPGEPGIFYFMGIGFTSSQTPANLAPILADMRRRAEHRNRMMVERINTYLSSVKVDYDRDVLPLTPTGNATERHILSAYIKSAARHFTDPALFWAEKLQLPEEQVKALKEESSKFQNSIRLRLMKRGGVGYVQPGPETFPKVEEVNQLVTGCGALPCAAWLDGTSTGEQAMEELLHLLISKGVTALSLIPDRNWNIADPKQRRLKVRNLYDVVSLAQKLDLPLIIGTEMNDHNQKLIDDFDAPELLPVRQAFLEGADFIYGHTVMQRGLGLGYQSDWAEKFLPTRRERNAFYIQVGRKMVGGIQALEHIKRIDIAVSPDEFLAKL